MLDFNHRNAEAKRPRMRDRGIYLLPNLFTTGALFAGFYAVVQAMNGRFEHAAVAIFIAMVLDGLDGRVARMTHTQSAFGAEYDSLSDMVSFGVAPALVIYEFALQGMGKLGWIAAFVYCAGAALRLARFNTQHETVTDKRFFQGLPSPAAAALIAGFVWVMVEYGVAGHDVRWLAAVMALLGGTHHGQQLPLLQRQGNQPQEERTVLCHSADRAGLHTGVDQPARSAVCGVCAVWAIRLWGCIVADDAPQKIGESRCPLA